MHTQPHPRSTCGVLLAVMALAAWVAQGQFTLDWSTIDGGGGTSTGGLYTVRGTVGQPDAGAMSGGNYALTGGFWSLLLVVPSDGAPLLSIYRTAPNSLAVTWPSPSAGWTLQQNTSGLDSVHWSNVTIGVQDDGTRRMLLINSPAGSRFYRLFKP